MVKSALAHSLFAQLTAALRLEPGVSEGTMFNSKGLRIDKKFFAFVGNDNRLIAKLPLKRVEAMVDQGVADRLSMGNRTMKQWIALQYGDDDATINDWRVAIEEAFAYVSSLPAAERKSRRQNQTR